MNLSNKKILIVGLIIVLLGLPFIYLAKEKLLGQTYFGSIKNELLSRQNERVVGVFFNSETAIFDASKTFTHIVLTINSKKAYSVDSSVLDSIHNNTNILLTIEFWDRNLSNKYDDACLTDIIDGSLDELLLKIYESLLANKKNVYVRINPEMELWVYNTPWQNSNNYLAAYRHVVQMWIQRNPELKFVYGPAGFMGAERFYPGDDVVDYTSITLQSESEKLHTRYPSYKNIKHEVHTKLHRLRFIDKPTIIINADKLITDSSINKAMKHEISSIIKHKEIAYKNTLLNKQSIEQRQNDITLGLYDPRKILLKEPGISCEHIFIDFGQIESGVFTQAIQDANSNNHDVILTVEPWKLYGNEKSDSNILASITNGHYDDIINKLYKGLNETNSIIYLRFAHEMEIPITRYSWQSKDPIDYIKAFRYFMQYVEPYPQNIKRVWGPAGDRGSSDFYPGDDVVDYVSFAAYGLPDKNITDYEKQRLFSSIFYDKIQNFRFINKPFFITEFGVKGPEDYKIKWMKDAAITLRESPNVFGACYFNMSDTPGAWGDIKEPDWSISPSTLQIFLEALK